MPKSMQQAYMEERESNSGRKAKKEERKRIIKIIEAVQSTEAQRQNMSSNELAVTELLDDILEDLIDKIDA